MDKQDIVGIAEASGPLKRNNVRGGEGTADHPVLHWRCYIRNIPLVDS